MYYPASEIVALIRKEAILEWRQLFAFNGILLYIVSTVFICYLSFEGVITVKAWNALFWIILVFASINAVLKGFLQEHSGRQLYYYSIADPRAIITAKIIYNAILMIIMAFLGFFVYRAFMGNPVESTGLFVANMVLGVIGFSSVLSMVSAIASKAKNNFTLMGVLSFPLILPLMLLLIKVSSAAVAGDTFANHSANLLVVFLIACITFVLSNLLFPYVWKE